MRIFTAVALSLSLVSGARAQELPVDEVPYIKTPQVVVDKMLDLAQVGADDYLIDLGSGDGRIIITAAKERGARGFGVELDDRLVDSSNEAARKAGVAERAQFFARDLFETDISQASVLTMYLLPAVNLQLRPRILEKLRPGTRVVSHDWDMGEWQPDAQVVLEGLTKPVMPIQASTVYLWIVPASVAGLWTLRLESDPAVTMELELTQRFQKIEGVAGREAGRIRLQSTNLRGAEISFTVEGGGVRGPSQPLRFLGRVQGEQMDGATATGQRWNAVRKGR